PTDSRTIYNIFTSCLWRGAARCENSSCPSVYPQRLLDRLRLRGHETVPVRVGDRLRPGVDAEFREDALDVARDGLRADPEKRRDLARPAAAGEQCQDVELAVGQRRHVRLGRARSGRLGTPALVEALDAREKLAGVERLGDVVVAADEEPC